MLAITIVETIVKKNNAILVIHNFFCFFLYPSINKDIIEIYNIVNKKIIPILINLTLTLILLYQVFNIKTIILLNY